MAAGPNDRVDISGPSQGHLLAVVHGLLKSGWTVVGAPEAGRLRRNGQLMILKTVGRDLRIRLFVYKVTGSSRGLPNERRIEITSTYRNGRIEPLEDFQDLVLGFDSDREVFVGVDARRIEEGGERGNASSFFDKEGLEWTRPNEILVKQHSAKLFQDGIEFHAFFKPQCVSEYLFNSDAIHKGSYFPSKLTIRPRSAATVDARLSIPLAEASGRTLLLQGASLPHIALPADSELVTAYETGDINRRRRKISQQTLLAIKLRCEENGTLGEEFVLNFERRRLLKAGKPDLAERVKWISPDSVGEGYDILSYEEDGAKRFIEVKATSGKQYVFEMSDNEWKVSKRRRRQYFIYRVTNVRSKPTCKIFQDPADLEKKGLLVRVITGWRITLK